MRGIARRLAGIRIRELVVAVVRERHIAAAPLVELADAREVGADRVAVLDADDRDLTPATGDAGHIGRCERKADLLRRDLSGQPVHGVELGDRLLDRRLRTPPV